ncbi:ankyrin repeat domain-containing protein [Alkalilimnicola ehrlichii]|uniref:Uncharacterized protein n=1 Tax=Alkalilimnicola ehrlichii TaxID=351052 RepID=A0A3E0WIK9_9GAMM|nr:ankyrin repeat domain-containing protein [Alkalilimnicola ehrlichii]RFA32820.1 hypothetical protein CAL65_18635 [Alkalilimnicola ehrlichii]
MHRRPTLSVLLAFVLFAGCSTETGLDAYINAVKADDRRALSKHYEQGMAPDQPIDDSGNTALHFAVSKAQWTLADYLIQEGASPYLLNAYGESPVALARQHQTPAARKWQAPYLKESLDRANELSHSIIAGLSADDLTPLLQAQDFYLDATPRSGQTLLSWAAEFAFTDHAIALIKAGALLDKSDTQGLTPLMLAVHAGDSALVDFLLKAGADPALADTNRRTALHHAIACRCDNDAIQMQLIERLLAAGAPTAAADRDNATPLMLSIANRRPALFDALLAGGAAINQPSRQGMTPLLFAVRQGNVDFVDRLLAAGADPLLTDIDSFAALHRVIINQSAYSDDAARIQVAERLIESGAAIDQVTDRDETALHLSLAQQDEAMIEWLISAGASLESRTIDGRTPLTRAVRTGTIGLVERLLAGGADPNGTEAAGETPLMLAAYEGYSDLVETLLAAAADPTMTSDQGSTALHFAAFKNSRGSDAARTEIVQRLVNAGTDINARNDIGPTPLIYSIDWQHAAVFNALIAAGADVNLASRSGSTPLLRALNTDNREMIDRLLAAGADPNLADSKGHTPLIRAVLNANERMVERLLSVGANTDNQDRYGWSALHHALSDIADGSDDEQTRIIQRLLAAGAPLNAPNNQGETAVHFSVSDRNGLFSLLRDAGADLNQADNDGQTPLMSAAANGNIRMLEQLIAADVDLSRSDNQGDTVIRHALSYGAWRSEAKALEMLERLIAAGAPLNTLNDINRSPLHAAISYELTDAVKLLLAAGADIDLAGELGPTPLTQAVDTGLHDMAAHLLTAGADPNRANSQGRTALMLAASKPDPEMVRLLLEAGADPNQRNAVGQATLHYAVKHPTYRDADVAALVNILLDAGALPNLNDIAQRTPLALAIDRDLSRTERALTRGGADRKLADGAVPTAPLLAAVNQADLALVKQLLNEGANPSGAGPNGIRPLHNVSISVVHDDDTRLLMAKHLLAAGARPNLANDHGETSLFTAIQYGALPIVEPLLEAGADPNLANNMGTTPLHIIASNRIVRRLSPEQETTLAQSLIDAGTYLDEPDSFAKTPLMYAAENNKIALVEALLRHGANPNLRAANGWTAASFARRERHQAVLELLEGE